MSLWPLEYRGWGSQGMEAGGPPAPAAAWAELSGRQRGCVHSRLREGSVPPRCGLQMVSSRTALARCLRPFPSGFLSVEESLALPTHGDTGAAPRSTSGGPAVTPASAQIFSSGGRFQSVQLPAWRVWAGAH